MDKVSPPYLQHADVVHLSGPRLSAIMDEVLEQGLPFRFRAGGTSMLPFIQDGDVLTIAPIEGRTPSVGAVVAYLANNLSMSTTPRLIVHRIIQHTPGGFMIRGDNQLSCEGEDLIANEQILGIVKGVERAGRPVRLGLGCERYLIVLLVRLGMLKIVVQTAAKALQIMRTKFSHNYAENSSPAQAGTRDWGATREL